MVAAPDSRLASLRTRNRKPVSGAGISTGVIRWLISSRENPYTRTLSADQPPVPAPVSGVGGWSA